MSMAWVAVGTAVVGAASSAYSSNKSAKATKDAAKKQTDAQGNALEYQQYTERLPLEYRDAGMKALGGEYGFTFDNEGNVISDGSTIGDRAKRSPFYTAMRSEGEDTIMRNASATGRLRGGATPSMLADNSQNAYLQAYNQQLQGLSSFAKTPLNTNAIAASMAGIGSTEAAGITAGAQAKQQGIQNAAGAIGSGLSMYGSYKQNQVPPPQSNVGVTMSPTDYKGYV